jgi:hypothetical protein
MISDLEIIKSYIDKSYKKETIRDLHAELLMRQSLANRERAIIPNVSSILVQNEGYIDKLGVSSARDLVTDNFGKLLASIFSNTAGTGSSVYLADYENNVQYPFIAGNWNTGDPPTAGRSGFFGDSTSSQGNTTYLVLGTGLTTVARSDYNVETACTGALGGYLPSTAGAGYGSGEVAFQFVSPAATVANDVAESAIFKTGINDHSQSRYICFLRYNYSPTTIAIGKQAVIDTTLYV